MKRKALFNLLPVLSLILASVVPLISLPTPVAAQGPAPGGLVLWNKLGSDEEVLNSAFGPNLEFYVGGGWPEVQGDREYVPGKYGNSVTLKGTYGNMDRIHNLVLNDLSNIIDPEKGCIEFWYYQTDGPIIYSHGVYRFFDGAYGLGSGMGFEAIHASGNKPARIRFYLGFGAATRKVWYSVANIPNDEWVHLAASWDRNGIDGTSETMRLYVNGEKVATTTENDWGNTVGERADICGGNDHNIIGKFRMDNLIAWDYAKTDFPDRESPLPIEVPADIKPGSCPNPLNVKKKGVLPVAILGTSDLDVSQIAPESVTLEGVAPLRWSLEDVATPFEPFTGKEGAFDCTEEGPDSYLDLTLKFSAQEVVAALGDVSDGEVRVLTLSGNLKDEFGGMPIVGEDVVVMLKKK